MNTHMDDQGTKAREEGAKLIIKYIQQYQKQYPAASVFLAGDFNSETDQEAYKVFSASDSPIRDLREQTVAEERYGDNNTFTGFGYDKPTRIDFLFLGKGQGWQANGYAVLENKFEDRVYNSDHRAVVGDVTLD
jgi:endonuclease/exonuclease/phosphatase family metal-dependent hydrolase